MPLTVISLIVILITGAVILFVTSRILPVGSRDPGRKKEEEEENKIESTFLPEDKELNALGKTVKALETAFFTLIVIPLRKLSKKLRYKKLQTEEIHTKNRTYELNIYMLRSYKYAEESAKMKGIIQPIDAVVRADTYKDLKEVALSEARLYESRNAEADSLERTSNIQ